MSVGDHATNQSTNLEAVLINAVIGETKQRLETRLREHQDACERGITEKSTMTEHAWENYHPINWEETSVLDRSEDKEIKNYS